MGIIAAVLIFSVIILIHEFGHFIAAKVNGVKVNEFSMGMGPLLLKKKKGETQYSLRLFPIGGYCAMEGEDQDSDSDRAFGKKKVWQRMIIICAGVFMNFLLGFILLVIQVANSDAITTTRISKFEDGAVSHATGLELDDEILEINGMRIFTSMDMSYKFTNDEDGVYDITVRRNGQTVKLEGVQLTVTDKTVHYDFWVYPGEITPDSTISEAVKQGLTDARLIYISLFDIVRGRYSLKDMSGPVGIVDSIDEVIDSEKDETTGKINWSSLMDTLLSLSAFITINVGVFNILPLPALDGGRFVFLVIEGIRGKPVPPEKEGLVHTIGMLALFGFMIIVTISDITKLV